SGERKEKTNTPHGERTVHMPLSEVMFRCKLPRPLSGPPCPAHTVPSTQATQR
ncbi:hypothetical protein BN1723_017499, partial [Verticillium longisporum]